MFDCTCFDLNYFFMQDGSSSQTITTAGTSEYVSSTANTRVQVLGYVQSVMITYKEVASGVTSRFHTVKHFIIELTLSAPNCLK